MAYELTLHLSEEDCATLVNMLHFVRRFPDTREGADRMLRQMAAAAGLAKVQGERT